MKSFIKQRLCNESDSLQIITFNLDFYYNTKKIKDFYDICKNADLVVPDGYGIVFLINKKYRIKINRLTGNQLFLLLLEIANELQLRIAFIGSTNEVQINLKEKIEKILKGKTGNPNHADPALVGRLESYEARCRKCYSKP